MKPVAEWWRDTANLAEFVQHMRDVDDFDPSYPFSAWVVDFLREPGNWSRQWNLLQVERAVSA